MQDKETNNKALKDRQIAGAKFIQYLLNVLVWGYVIYSIVLDRKLEQILPTFILLSILDTLAYIHLATIKKNISKYNYDVVIGYYIGSALNKFRFIRDLDEKVKIVFDKEYLCKVRPRTMITVVYIKYSRITHKIILGGYDKNLVEYKNSVILHKAVMEKRRREEQ